MTEYPLHRRREKYIYDRGTTISPLYVGLRVNIYSGRKFYTKFVNKWMIGFKFGEFVWNRKLAMYKAKQLRKKKKKKKIFWNLNTFYECIDQKDFSLMVALYPLNIQLGLFVNKSKGLTLP